MAIESDFDASEVFEVAGSGRGQRIQETPGLAHLVENHDLERDTDVPGMDADTVASAFEGDTSVVAQEASYDDFDEDDDVPDVLSEMGF